MNIVAIFLYLLPITIIISIQEVATEAWMLTILGEERAKGGFAFRFGKGLGYWIGFPAFTRFHS